MSINSQGLLAMTREDDNVICFKSYRERKVPVAVTTNERKPDYSLDNITDEEYQACLDQDLEVALGGVVEFFNTHYGIEGASECEVLVELILGAVLHLEGEKNDKYGKIVSKLVKELD